MRKAAKKAPAKRKAPKKPAGEKNKGGRPSKFTQAIIDTICARLSKGEPLAVICRDEGMPDPSTVWDWEQARPDVSQAIARAREVGEHAIAADCLLIADDAGGDFRMGEKSVIVDTDHIQRSKLRIETRLKLLAKWNPRKWGDKVQHANDPENPMPASVTFLVQPVAPKGE